MDADQHRAKLAAARRKYGRAFAHEVRVARLTAPSTLLQQLDAYSAGQRVLVERRAHHIAAEAQPGPVVHQLQRRRK